MELGIAGERALITEASKGIGLACAQTLAGEGCDVALGSRSGDLLQQHALSIGAAHGVAAHLVVADLSSLEGVRGDRRLVTKREISRLSDRGTNSIARIPKFIWLD